MFRPMTPALVFLAGCGGRWDPPLILLGPTGADTEDDLAVAILDRQGAPDRAVPTFQWFNEGALQVDLLGPVVPADRTTRGETWEVRVGWDGSSSNPAITSLTIANAPPVASVVIDPPAPSGDDALVAKAEGTDPDGDSVSFAWSWKRNGVSTSELGSVIAASETDEQDLWEVTVVPTDGRVDGAPVVSSVIVGNHAPTVQSVYLGPEPAYEMSVLTAEAEISDPDGDATTTTYSFDVNGAMAQDGPANSLTGASFSRGDTVVATVVTSDGEFQTSGTSNTVVIDNSGPVVSGLVLSPSDPRESDVVQCSWATVVDPDGDAISATTLSWLVNGTLVQVGGSLDGTAFDKGDLVACDVQATDVDGAVGPTSTALTVADNNPPLALSATLSTTSPDGSAPVTVSGVATDADDDAITWFWTWRVDGVIVSNGDTLTVDKFTKGATIIAEGLPSDDEEPGNSVFSNAAVATNSAPLVEASISPNPPVTDDVVTATWSASDADGDPLTVQRWWTVAGLRVLEDVDQIDGSFIAKGQEVAFHAFANDGVVDGPETIVSAIVADTAASVSAATVEPSPLTVTEVASCAPIGWSDLDGDEPAFTVEWRVNGLIVADTLTLASPAFVRDDVVSCILTPDTGVAGIPVESPAVVVGNAAPSAPVAVIAPSTSIWGHEDLVCALAAPAIDADGDTVTYDVHWSTPTEGDVLGTETVQPNDTIAAGQTLDARTWTCTLFSNDGTDSTPSAPVSVSPEPAGGNLLLIIADDLGVDKVGAYGEHPDPPPTPALDRLAADGMFFRNAYASTVCAPTRANLFTGRHGHRTGVGKIIDVWTYDYALPDTEVGLPLMIASSTYFDYSNSHIGKWHLGSAADGPTYPDHFGFEWYQGSLGNLGDPSTIGTLGARDYFNWERNDNGVVEINENYATVESTDAALARMDELDEPWVIWLAYNAPHEPLHVPPAYLHSYAGLDDSSSDYEKYQAMVESLDSEIGRLMASMDPAVLSDTNVFFMGDNGTPKHGISPPFDPEKGKGSVREGGVNVPLIVMGPLVSVPGSESEAFVHAVDIFATFAAIVGVDVREIVQQDLNGNDFPIHIDGVSILPYLSDPSREGANDTAFVERFEPNGDGPFEAWSRALREEKYKLIRTDQSGFAVEEFFDISSSPVEVTEDELLAAGPLDPEAQEAYDRLSETLDAHEIEIAFEVPEHPPEAWLVLIDPSPAYASATLTCLPVGVRDSDGDDLTFRFDWSVDGVDVAEHGAELVPSHFALGSEVACTVTPNDGLVDGQSAVGTVIIGNAAPTLFGAALLPEKADASTVFTCLPAGLEDLDGDPITLTYTWRVGPGLLLDTGPTLQAAFVDGDEVQCGIVASDGKDSTPEVRSNTVNILNDRPEPPTVEILPPSPVPGVDDLWCAVVADAVDADGDPLAYGFSWTLDGEVYVGPTATTLVLGDTIPASETESDQGWVCQVLTWDTKEIGDPAFASVWLWDIEPDVWPTGLDFRPVNSTCLAGARPSSGTAVDLVVAYSLVLDQPISMHHPPNDDSYWYVILQGGEIVRFENSPDTEVFTVSLDIHDLVHNLPGAQAGLLGMAFDPDFDITGEILVFYSTPPGDEVFQSTSRISRFTSFDGGVTFDPTTEEVLFELDQEYEYDKGGQIAFDDEGYFWFSHGDGGGELDPYGHGQDTFSFFSKILRVDLQTGYPWGIPDDNPFADGVEGLPEIWAYGFRNPWRWSFDPSGDLWVGDVGSDQVEEISLISRGGNAGWSITEGSQCVTEPCSTVGLTPPAVEWSHDGESAAVIGGLVYQGGLIPDLNGAYLYTDYFGGGPLNAIRKSGGAFVTETLMPFTGRRLVSFAEDKSNEVFAVDHESGQIFVLVPADPVADSFPGTLSQTGCVDPTNATLPAAGLIPFDVTTARWSDGADATRYLALPQGTTLGLLDDEDLDFPPGTVLMKTFEIGGSPVETQLLMRHDDGEWAGYSYEWNEDGTDADLLVDSKTKEFGGQEWAYPSRGNCLECHTDAAHRALGPEVLQLNKEWLYPNGRVANQIETWRHIGLFTDDPGAADSLPALTGLDELAAPVEDRARSYLHANCAHCHTAGGTGSGPADFHYFAADPTYCDVAPFGSDLGAGPEARIFAPEQPENSVLYLRMVDLGSKRMPPLATSILDAEVLGLIEEWIATTSTCTF